MSRARLTYVLAAFGILITTGGCADSATAPEAMTAGPALDRAYGDSVAAANRPTDDDGATTLSGGYLSGGSRSDY
jgi:hypothetical protein